MSSHLSVGDRWRIMSLRFDQNMTPGGIASSMNCTIRTVFNILRLYHETNNVTEGKGRDRNLLNQSDIRILRQLFYRYPVETAFNIRNRFFQRTNIFLTYRTIRNYRRRLGFHPVHARQQPMLNEQHAQQRLLFCRQYTQYDYRRIIFTDEKAFEVDASGIVQWIPRNRPRPLSYRSQIQYRIAVFGGVWYNSRSNLVFIRERTDASAFVRYLQQAFYNHFRSITNYYFIHDRPTWAHTPTAHNWLHKHRIILFITFYNLFI